MTYTVMDIQNERRGFAILSAIIAGFFILSLMVMVFNVKERRSIHKKSITETNSFGKLRVINGLSPQGFSFFLDFASCIYIIEKYDKY